MILGLRTVIYNVTDLAQARTFYSQAFGVQPYFDQPFYVGFNVGGYELGLDPNGLKKTGAGGSLAYWGVGNIQESLQHFVSAGATPVAAIQDVGDNIKVATVADPFGNEIGLIENPQFSLPGGGS